MRDGAFNQIASFLCHRDKMRAGTPVSLVHCPSFHTFSAPAIGLGAFFWGNI